MKTLTYFCVLCHKITGFTCKANLRKHCLEVHQHDPSRYVVAGRPFNMHSSRCYTCRISFKFIRELRDHLEVRHNFKAKSVAVEFSDLAEFEKWKTKLELTTFTRYRPQCGFKNGIIYYNCYSRATGVELPDRKIKFRSHNTCTSQIVVSRRKGISAIYHRRHYGHGPVPMKEIRELSQMSAGDCILATNKKKREEDASNPKNKDSYKRLTKNVIALFKKRIAQTATDIENEACHLQERDIDSETIERLQSAWQLVKQAKMKLVEANARCLVPENPEYLVQDETDSSSTEEECDIEEINKTIQEKSMENGLERSINENLDDLAKCEELDSIHLRPDEKYKSSHIEPVDFHISYEEFMNLDARPTFNFEDFINDTIEPPNDSMTLRRRPSPSITNHSDDLSRETGTPYINSPLVPEEPLVEK